MSTNPQTVSGGSSTPPPFNPTQEVRFAVVLYGGVSLAIYIHGVTQELLRLVRATAPQQAKNKSDHHGTPALRPRLSSDPQDSAREGTESLIPRALLSKDQLRGSEKVYRKLGQILAAGCSPLKEDPEPEDPVCARFLVDVISGTSAGGINGIFLAKALAGDLSMDALKELWIREGDFAKLLNDRRSYEDLGISPPKGDTPASLLNSRRMYVCLLQAFAAMERGQPLSDRPQSSLVTELDLAVTTTDIGGLVQPIRLTDQTVHERRHRQVFRFRYATEQAAGEARNDFLSEFNPFLAYAARCTSSFPLAFEPMTLEDVDAVLGLPTFSHYKPRASETRWRRFYREYLRDLSGAVVSSEERDRKFARVAFGDGGYLDNRPFSYTTEVLRRRRSDVPVDRKLIYVEPSPEHPEEEAEVAGKPDALANVQAAVLTLPRYETIREDIERIHEYNQLIRRVRVVLDGREDDVRHRDEKEDGKKPRRLSGAEWRKLDLRRMISHHGVSYGAYHRLRVAATTDALATLLVTPLGCEENSLTWQAVRELLRVWRSNHYICYRNNDHELTENEFLYSFDIEWWLRRVRFSLEQADQLYCEKDTELPKRVDRIPDLKLRKLAESSVTESSADFRQALVYCKWGLNDSMVQLRRILRDLASREDSRPEEGGRRRVYKAIAKARKLIDELNLGKTCLLDILASPADLEQHARVKLQEIGPDRFGKALEAIREALGWAIRRSAHSCETVLGLHGEENKPYYDIGKFIRRLSKLLHRLGVPAEGARSLLRHYYGNFEQYDLISFPILYETGVSEADEVEILRISPEDAVDLFDERRGTRRRTPSEGGCETGRIGAGHGRPKLAGNALGHFGAFLKEEWRVNDMLWGRLDAAERLICTLLPGAGRRDLRERLIREAHREILAEEMQPSQEERLRALLAEARELAPARESKLARVRELEEKRAARKAEKKRKREGIGITDEETLLQARRTEARRQMEIWFQELAGADQARIDRLAQCILGEESLSALFIEISQNGRALPAKDTLSSAARATEIIGRMLESLADQNQSLPGAQRWAGLVTFFGRISWGLVEVAVPRGVPNLITRHWLRLLYTFEIFLIAGGLVLGSEEVARTGWTFLGITAGLNLVLFLLGGVLRSSYRLLRWARMVGLVLLVGLALLGLFAAPEAWNRTKLSVVNRYHKVVHKGQAKGGSPSAPRPESNSDRQGTLGEVPGTGRGRSPAPDRRTQSGRPQRAAPAIP